MSRIDKACCGDCAQCALLADGVVEMVPCVLDQIFKRQELLGEAVRRLSESVARLSAAEATPPKLAAKIKKGEE